MRTELKYPVTHKVTHLRNGVNVEHWNPNENDDELIQEYWDEYHRITGKERRKELKKLYNDLAKNFNDLYGRSVYCMIH